MLQSEGKVLSFMDQIDKQNDLDRERDEIRNSVDGKLKFLDKCKQDAKDKYIDCIFAKIYKDATPLNDEYKNAYHDDLMAGFRDFINSRSDRGMDYYIREAIKRSPFARRIVEAVDDMIEKDYKQKEMNIDNIDPEELVFKSSDDMTKRLDVMSRDFSGDDISEQIRDQVKRTALSEIRRAKEEKESLKQLEKDLSKDPSITDNKAVESALEMKGYRDNLFYTPSLFEGVMIHKANKLMKDFTEGTFVDTPLYGVMDDFRMESMEYEDTVTESVKDAILKLSADVKKALDNSKSKLAAVIKAIKNKISKANDVKESVDLSDIGIDQKQIDKYSEVVKKLEDEYNEKVNKLLDKAIEACAKKNVDPYTNDYLNYPEIKKEIDELHTAYVLLTQKYTKKINDMYDKLVKDTPVNESTVMDHAFIEAVKEYTALTMLKALKLESFTYNDVEKLAEEYAYTE